MSKQLRFDQAVLRQVEQAAEKALLDAGEHILEQANRTVPIDEGTLRRSGQVSQQGLRVVVSYDTPYAARQHEDTRLRHASGRRAKWLERTLQEQGGRVRDFVADRIRRAL